MTRRTGATRLLGAVSLTLAAIACSDPVSPPTARDDPSPAARASQPPTVHVVYLVPSDQDVNRTYVQAIRAAAENVQAWFQDALGTGATFALARPTVTVLHLEHAASWYATTPREDEEWLWFWFNVLEEAFELTGGHFGDPDDLWVYYVDAAPACGQGTGAAASVALLPRNDLLGLAGEPTIGTCSGQPEADQGTCRWVGGLGHEVGHALGLPHPAGCEEGLATCATRSLMWFGYFAYPDTFLTPAEQAALLDSPFITPMRLTGSIRACDALTGPVQLRADVTQDAWRQRSAAVAPAAAACPFRALSRAVAQR